MKVATVEAQILELKGNSYATGRGQGSTTKAAISRAFADLFKQPNISRKRFTTIKATITITRQVESK